MFSFLIKTQTRERFNGQGRNNKYSKWIKTLPRLPHIFNNRTQTET